MGTVEMPLTKEEFEAAYVMWKCGGSAGRIHHDLAAVYNVGASTLAWCFIMRSDGTLNKYTVHYKDSNQPTI